MSEQSRGQVRYDDAGLIAEDDDNNAEHGELFIWLWTHVLDGLTGQVHED